MDYERKERCITVGEVIGMVLFVLCIYYLAVNGYLFTALCLGCLRIILLVCDARKVQ
jgi:membrane-bound ClpP family serine protease